MQILMISLPDALERQDNARRQFARAGVNFEILQGIDGRTATTPLFESYDADHYLLSCGRHASDGEQGCYASHIKAWQYCVDHNEPVIVLEDDAQLEPDFAAALPVIAENIEELGFIRIEPMHGRPTLALKQCGGFALHYCLKYPHDATAYALSPTVARKFIEDSRVLRAPADKYIKEFWLHEQPLYCLIPYCVQPGPLAEDSQIAGRQDHRQPLALRLRRSCYKAVSALRRFMFNRHQRPRG